MKNLLKSLALVAVSALAVASCQKNELASQNDGEGVFFSLRTGDAGKTYIVAGEGESAGKYLPMWKEGDQVKVFFGDPDGTNNTPYGPLTNQNEDGQTADFQGTITGYDVPEEGNLYAFYPASSFVQVYATGVGLELPVLQNPTASSFDPAADILVSKKTTFLYDSSENYWFAEPQFARVPAILKINVFSSSFESVQGDVISKFTVESSSNEIAGRLVVDFAEGLGKVNKVNSSSKSVSAVYDTERYISVGSAATSTNCSVFLLVNAGELAAGSTLTFTGVGATYNIKKVINIDDVVKKTGKPFVLTPGNLTEINLSLAEENCEIPTESDWKLVKNVNDLAAGDLIEIGCISKTAAAGPLYNSYEYFTSVSAEFSEDGETMASDAAVILVLGGDATNGWSLTLDGQQVGYSGANLAKNENLWDITIKDDGTAEIKTQTTTPSTMKYNSGSPRFKPYASGQTSIQIYKFYGTREPLATPTNVQAAVDGEKANKLNVSWDVVDNAVAYEVVVSGGVEDIVERVETNSLSVEGLEYEKEYSVTVKAVSGDYTKYKDSEYSGAAKVTTGAKPAGLKYYEKVVSAPADWCGDYLIVYEAGKVAFDGSLTTLDAPSNTKAVTITDNKIEATTDMKAIQFTVAYKTGSSTVYSLKSASGKYISGTTTTAAASNGLKQADTDANYEITFNGLTIESKSSDQQMVLKYNKSNDQTRFRFFKSGQEAVALYKLSDPRTALPTPANLSVNGMTVSWDAVSGAGSYKVTVNGVETSVNTNSYDYTGAAGYYDVSVYAVPDETASATYKNSDAATLAKAKFGEPVLETPVLESNGVTASSVSAKWTVDPNASNGYLCQLYNGEDFVSDQTVSTGAVTFTNLTEDTEYTVKVQAKAVTGTYAYAASGVASIKLTPAGLHIKDITSEGTYNIGGLLVYAVSGSNVILGDNTGKILFYKSSHGLAVGDKVDVNGNVEEYNGVWEFKGAAISNKTTGNPVDHGTPVELSTISSYGTAPTITYVHATGTQDDSRNITTDGANSYKLYLSAESADNVGKPVDVTGYTHGYYASKSTVSFIALDIHLDGISVDPSSVTLGAESGSTAKVNVTSSVAWTANTSSDWTVSPASGNAGTTEVTITASKAGGDAEATLADLVFTQTGTSKSATVTVKQQKTGGVTWTRVTTIKELTDGGTFIMGYEATAKSGKIIPLRSKDCNAKTTANGYFNTGTTANSSTSGTIDMSKLTESADYEVYISSPVSGKINIQMKDENGSYYGATNGGTTKNTGRLYTSGNSNETNLTPAFSSEQDNQFKLTGDVSGSYKYLKYNTSSPRFAYYNSAGSNIVFYKKN